MSLAPPHTPWLAVLAGIALAGCDPKLTATDGGDLPGDDLPDPVVTPEALAVGNVVALHAELLEAGLSVAAQYDTAQAAATRGVLTEGCWALTEDDAQLPTWGLRLDGCTDAHGTEYRGGGQFDRVTDLDGYAFFPWYDVDLLRATNAANDDYNHDIHSGSLELGFARTSGAVTSVHVDKFLRHNVRSEIVTFTYDGVQYTGVPGSFGEYPDAGSVVRVVWDSVGVFDVEFQAGGTALYTIQGVTYHVDLDTGDVTIADGSS
jgi:hypothetical protein